MKADLLLQGAQVFDSAFRCFRTASVAILDGRILYAGTDEEVLNQIEPQEVADLSGRWIVPGLIDIHMHIESSMVTPPAFLKAVLQHGTSTCIAEPHEIANVFGTEGIEEFIRLAPADDPERAEVFFGAPSSVPSTDLEDAGAAGHLLHARRAPGDRAGVTAMQMRTVVVDKIASTGNERILVTDRGTSFGYGALISDFRGLPTMAETGYPVVFDATHSVQQPGGQGATSACGRPTSSLAKPWLTSRWCASSARTTSTTSRRVAVSGRPQ